MSTTRPITGTHVYSLVACEHRVALDLHGDPAARRALRADEEFVLERGRRHEAEFVARLGWEEPRYPARDWNAGCAATLAMLRDGVEGVLQGVLSSGDRLGIPDLLRREPGASALGDWHYVVGDVKSSRAARGDQLLQAAFYAELLTALQERAPDYVYIVLRDGREERFPFEPLRHALHDVLARLDVLRREPAASRPFLVPACDACRWSEVCRAELQAARDLSLLPGVTPALRATLESAGIGTFDALATAPTERLAASTRIEPALLRRLARSARARIDGRPLPERVGSGRPIHPGAYVHVLVDAYADRTLWVGLLAPGARGDDDLVLDLAVPDDEDAAVRAFAEAVAGLPSGHTLLHHGRTIVAWYESRAIGNPALPWLEDRFVDLARRLRGVASWPGPVFDLADRVQQGLGLDPHRAGRAAEAALRAAEPDGAEWLCAKGRSDLADLAALDRRYLRPRGRARADGARGEQPARRARSG